MSKRGSSEKYEIAARRMLKHMTRAADGTFLLSIKDAKSINVDPVVFADLRRSLEEMNNLIRRGEVNSNEVEFIP